MSHGMYPAAAGERAMKIQEVILRAIDGRVKWYEAAEIQNWGRVEREKVEGQVLRRLRVRSWREG